jgi:hypothetical protein
MKTTYILGKSNLGGNLGPHWVVIEDFSVSSTADKKIITYSTNGTSIFDYSPSRRNFTSDNSSNERSGTIIKIETYMIN